MLKKSDYFYELPESADRADACRAARLSRLLVYDRATGKSEDRIFRDIKEYLRPGDVLVINNTKVLPARLFAYTENGGRVEVLLLKRHDLNTWEVLVRPGKKAKPGVRLTVSEELSLTVLDRTETGERIVEFRFDGVLKTSSRASAPCRCPRTSTKNSKIKTVIRRCTARRTALPPRRRRGCTSPSSCSPKSRRWACRSPKCCCTSASAPSAPSKRRT